MIVDVGKQNTSWLPAKVNGMLTYTKTRFRRTRRGSCAHHTTGRLSARTADAAPRMRRRRVQALPRILQGLADRQRGWRQIRLQSRRDESLRHQKAATR